MEILKHECGVAMIRLLKPLEYYKRKYGTWGYGLGKLYLLMEKQHNRGQEGAGIGVVKLHGTPGNEYVFRERALGKDAIQEIFGTVNRKVEEFGLSDATPRRSRHTPRSSARSTWVTCVTRPPARAASRIVILSCAATTGARATC